MPVLTKKRKNGTLRVQFQCEGPSKVEQSHRDEVNINSIMAKYQKTGLFPQRTTTPKYGDFSSGIEFHEAMSRIREAERDFLDLPPDIRSRFENDPGQLVDFLNNPENAAEAAELGLIEKPAPAEPSTEIVDPGVPGEPVEAPGEPATPPA